MIDLVKIGKTGKTFGSSGAIKVYPEERFKEDFTNAKFLFVDIYGSCVPFLINSRPSEYIVELEDISSPEQASKLVNNDLYLEKSDLKRLNLPENLALDHQLIGYEVIDLTGDQVVGKITDVREFPQQIMLIVDGLKGELMIPFNEEWLDRILGREAKLYMNLPIGLY